MNFTVQVHHAEEGGFWAEVNELPGCITQGDTAEELEANLKEVIEQSIDGLIEDYIQSLSGNAPGIERGDATWTISLQLRREKASAKTHD
jgi:predicted RNase H-like HicB family nuclease